MIDSERITYKKGYAISKVSSPKNTYVDGIEGVVVHPLIITIKH